MSAAFPTTVERHDRLSQREQMNKIPIILVALSGTLMATAAAAYDFFLMPDAFSTRRVGPLVIRAIVGSTFPAPQIVVTLDRVERVWLVARANGCIKPTP